MEKKKLLFVITKSNWGGAQRYVYNLATSLPRDEFDVAVAAGGAGGFREASGLLARKSESAGLRFITIRHFMRNVWILPDILVFFELLALFRRERPDIAHLNSSKAGAIGGLAARITGIRKIIFTSHGLVYDEDRSVAWKVVVFIGSWLTFLLCTDVIVLSENNRARVAKLPLVGKKVHLIHNGIPALTFETRGAARAELVRRSGGREFEICIGAIAELTPNKGLPTLIKAVANLPEEAHALIIGEGSDREALQAQIERGGWGDRVCLLGFIEEAYRYLPAFDILALPSLKEGLPYVLLEAGQAGIPVIASNIPGVRDIITNEETGLLVPAQDADALAAGLTRLMREPELRVRLGNALQQKVSREFSIDQMVRKTVTCYRS